MSYGATISGVSAAGNVVTYTIAAPSGTWGASPQGAYTVSLVAGQVLDSAGVNAVAGNPSLATFMVDTEAPTATLTTAPPTINFAGAGGSTTTLTVTYADSTSGINAASLSTSNLAVSNGTTVAPVTGVSAAGNAVTYTITAPAGTWGASTQGTYTVSLLANQVADQAGNAAAAIPSLATFLVNTAVAQPPVVAVGNAGAITFIRGGAAVAVAPHLTLADSSYTDLLSATVTLSGGPLDAPCETLAADTAGTAITAAYNAAGGVLTLSGSDTLAHYQQVLQSVTYVDSLKTTTNTGSRTLSFSVSDASNPSTPATGSVAFDVAPQVVGVYVSGSAWNSKLFNALAAAGVGSATLGFDLAGGTGQLSNANIPGWTTLDQISIVFSEPVSGATLSSLSLGDSGNNHGTSSGITVSGESNTGTTVVTFTFSGALTSNKYYIDLAASGITDAAGAELDGEWTNGSSTFAAGSGDGAPGGDFIYRFNVLAGDVNGDGKVNTSDVTKLRSIALGNDSTSNWRYDINGDGRINTTDVTTLRSRPLASINNFPEPTLPASNGSGSATGSPAAPDGTGDGAALDAAAAGPASGGTASAVTTAVTNSSAIDTVSCDTATVSSDTTAVSSDTITASSDPASLCNDTTALAIVAPAATSAATSETAAAPLAANAAFFQPGAAGADGGRGLDFRRHRGARFGVDFQLYWRLAGSIFRNRGNAAGRITACGCTATCGCIAKASCIAAAGCITAADCIAAAGRIAACGFALRFAEQQPGHLRRRRPVGQSGRGAPRRGVRRREGLRRPGLAGAGREPLG